jgi:hypothetical protein
MAKKINHRGTEVTEIVYFFNFSNSFVNLKTVVLRGGKAKTKLPYGEEILLTTEGTEIISIFYLKMISLCPLCLCGE